MVLSEIGAIWLWLLLAAGSVLLAASKDVRDSLRGIAISLWEICRVLSGAVSYRKEAEPVGQFFSEVLSRLLRSGFDNASAYVGLKYSKRRIEFRKYFRDHDYGIELRFPSDKWASAYFQKLRTYCEALDIPYRMEADDTDNSREILFVDFGRDVEAAADLTRGIWTEVFGLLEDAPRRFSYQGISSFGELVDRADQKRMTFEEGWRYLHPDREHQPVGKGCAEAIWNLYGTFVLFGLVISALSSRGDVPEWSLRFAEVSFGGSTEGLVFLCLFLFNVTVGRFVRKRLALQHPPRNPPWLEKVHRPFAWIVRITLPLAVVLVWTHL